ncbi:4-oxalomesaconate tautomerase [Pseudomonas lini]
MSQTRIPCLMMRGGTSKGAFILADDLPPEGSIRDQVLMAIMGSPDPRQIDGIGGANSLTSKVAILRQSARLDADIDYLFGQVLVDQAKVDYGQNCGNILAGVGPFAVERAMVQAVDGVTRVRVFMENTGQIAVISVPTPQGVVSYTGDARIDGVLGTSAPLIVDFEDIAGSSCGELLPTGNAIDLIDGIEVTCIDNGMPVVLLRASDVGRTGYESPEQLDADVELKSVLESIRLQAGQLMNLGDVRNRTVPKMTLIAPPRNGGAISSRTFIPHRCHASIGVFGAVSVGTACQVQGSVASGLANVTPGERLQLSVEHPTGEFTVELRVNDGKLTGCGLLRTSRLIFDGKVCIPRSIWDNRASN